MSKSREAYIYFLICASALTACALDPIGTDRSVEARQEAQPSRLPQEFADARFGSAAPPRIRIPIDTVLRALGDPKRSDGLLIVGLKEANAVRGVSISGIALAEPDRAQAQEQILSDQRQAELIRGWLRPFERAVAGKILVDTVRTTSILLRVPLTRESLNALQQHPNVDYLEPNWIGETMSATTTGLVNSFMRLTETRAWGIDSVRAPYVWGLGYTGGTVPIGIADTGFDLGHPDFQFTSSFSNFTTDQPDNPCTTAFTACWYELPFHGSGVLGIARAQHNSAAAVGVAPGGTGTVDIAKVAFVATGGTVSVLRDTDFVEGVIFISSALHSYGITDIAVTSVGFNDTLPANYQNLRDAFATAYNQQNVLWFASAGNSGSIMIPAAFDDVVAVGGLMRQSGTLVRAQFGGTIAFTSPEHPQVELVAPAEGLVVSWNRGSGNPTITQQGTSMAAPIALGVARLALDRFPSLTASQLRQELQSHARDLGTAGKDNQYGYGMVDAKCVVLQTLPCV